MHSGSGLKMDKNKQMAMLLHFKHFFKQIVKKILYWRQLLIIISQLISIIKKLVEEMFGMILILSQLHLNVDKTILLLFPLILEMELLADSSLLLFKILKLIQSIALLSQILLILWLFLHLIKLLTCSLYYKLIIMQTIQILSVNRPNGFGYKMGMKLNKTILLLSNHCFMVIATKLLSLKSQLIMNILLIWMIKWSDMVVLGLNLKNSKLI